MTLKNSKDPFQSVSLPPGQMESRRRQDPWPSVASATAAGHLGTPGILFRYLAYLLPLGAPHVTTFVIFCGWKKGVCLGLPVDKVGGNVSQCASNCL